MNVQLAEHELRRLQEENASLREALFREVADHNITYNQVLVLSQELQAAERKRQDGPFELSGRMPARARSSDAACEVPERAAERVGRQCSILLRAKLMKTLRDPSFLDRVNARLTKKVAKRRDFDSIVLANLHFPVAMALAAHEGDVEAADLRIRLLDTETDPLDGGALRGTQWMLSWAPRMMVEIRMTGRVKGLKYSSSVAVTNVELTGRLTIDMVQTLEQTVVKISFIEVPTLDFKVGTQVKLKRVPDFLQRLFVDKGRMDEPCAAFLQQQFGKVLRKRLVQPSCECIVLEY